MPVRESMLEVIRRGGPLGTLFQRASSEILAALEPMLASSSPGDLLYSLVEESHQQLTSGVEASPLTVLRQCDAGCNACCHTACVDVTPLEAIVVADYLLTTYETGHIARFRHRLAENAANRAAGAHGARARLRLRCGLLGDDGLCQAYAARPLVCAGVFSLSRAACESAATSTVVDDAMVPLDRPAKAWTMGISGGLQRALVAAGLDGNLYELNSAVLCALTTPNAGARWLAREDIFAECACTDGHSPPRAPRESPVRRADAAHGDGPPSEPARAIAKPRRKQAPRRR